MVIFINISKNKVPNSSTGILKSRSPKICSLLYNITGSVFKIAFINKKGTATTKYEMKNLPR